MARRCAFTQIGVMSGNNVSHANNKTRRRFLPNLQHVSFVSDLLGTAVQIRVTTAGIRSIEKNGGIDAYLLKARDRHLGEEALKLKRRIQKVAAQRA